jgi:hypothetical protein
MTARAPRLAPLRGCSFPPWGRRGRGRGGRQGQGNPRLPRAHTGRGRDCVARLDSALDQLSAHSLRVLDVADVDLVQANEVSERERVPRLAVAVAELEGEAGANRETRHAPGLRRRAVQFSEASPPRIESGSLHRAARDNYHNASAKPRAQGARGREMSLDDFP